MNFQDFKELITKTRTTRRYKQNITIADEDIKELIDVARITSSAKNMQVLKYITVTNKDNVRILAKKAMWATHLKDWTQKEDEIPSAFIVILNDKNIEGQPLVDVGTALETIMLGAKLKGIDSAPLASIDKELCQELFTIPENCEVILGIALGHASELTKIVEMNEDDTTYYRDEKDTHCVPKRSMDEILIGSY